MTFLSKERRAQWSQGTLKDAYKFLGAHPKAVGVQFSVWAPHAREVHVVGDFNDWNKSRDEMTRQGDTGFWQTTLKSAKPGQYYKYAITATDGTIILKADPFAFYAQAESYHASAIYAFPQFEWHDTDWLQKRGRLQQPDKPLSIYEVHLGSWQQNEGGKVLTYKQLAKKLIPYVKNMGFTHIELLPVMEHPYTPSWGYQVTGFYAPTSRYGRPEDFMAFIDECHRHNLGVILDWVPGHFPKDEHGLHFFDGKPLYEHADEKRHNDADWGTHKFNFENPGVCNFLLSNVFFWCEKYHVDGFRVDAVASILYLDYSKSEGEWLPNKYGSYENLGAVDFLKNLNQQLKKNYPDVLSIAEESTAWPGITASPEDGGLGFDYKWNIGWMNDTLQYFSKVPEKRMQNSHDITFPRTFAFSEHFVLPFSHDEVVHLKKSLWSKMPGTPARKFVQLRLLLLYMISYPGKKLLFMGSELAQKHEWAVLRPLHWDLLEAPRHKNLQQYLKNLLTMYKQEPILFETDHDEQTFTWTDLSQKDQGLFSFSRREIDGGQKLTFIFNFSPRKISRYTNEVADYNRPKLIFDNYTNTGHSIPDKNIDWPLQLRPFEGLVIKTDDKD